MAQVSGNGEEVELSSYGSELLCNREIGTSNT